MTGGRQASGAVAPRFFPRSTNFKTTVKVSGAVRI